MENCSNVLSENKSESTEKCPGTSNVKQEQEPCSSNSEQSGNSLQGQFPNDNDFLFPKSKTIHANDGSQQQETEMKKVIGSNSTTKATSEQPEGQGSSTLFVIPSSSSVNSAESVCRICQLAVKETGENLKLCECECKGYLAKVHVSCLTQWVRYRGSNRCEICQSYFAGVSPPETPGVLQREAMTSLAWQLERTRPFTRRKRAAMAAVVVFLVIVTCVTSLLTVSADREFKRISLVPWSTKKDLEESNVVFSICIAFTFFCATMTIGLLIIWLGMECCYHYHRRNILRAAALRLVAQHNELANTV